ncbi:MAG: IS4 family transposase [Candidatus Sedimenticola sp. (ex Thyasira tokunagai)]
MLRRAYSKRGRSQWWKQRRVVVVDGTGVSMPDTQANQAIWPQQAIQKPGCGFPQARVCACFCLQTGALLSYRTGNRKQQELPLLRQQMETFEPGDIFLGDKGFCSYYDVWKFQQGGIDSILTLARRTPVEASSAIKVLGADDLLIQWPKPRWNKVLSYSKEQWQALPEQLILRQIKITVDTPGFRVKSFYLVTTLTDVSKYSAAELADLYYKRWDVELFFET